jgi:hypothetical protein
MMLYEECFHDHFPLSLFSLHNLIKIWQAAAEQSPQKEPRDELQALSSESANI